jgi:hypothetical protein
MLASYFLAKLIGPFSLILGLGVLLSGTYYRAMAVEFLNSRALVFLAGVITLSAGLAIVIMHNVWVLHWPLIITVLGWLMVLSAIVRIVTPEYAMAKGRAMIARSNVMAIAAAVWLIIGVILTFFGYFQTA